jgi:hypothetical protein
MNILLRTVIVTVLLLTLSPVVSSDEPDKLMHNKCLYPAVTLKPSQGGGNGSAIIIRSEKVGKLWHNVALSAAHVFSPQPYVVRVFEYENWSTIVGFKDYPAIFYRANKLKDTTVVLFISDKEMPVADLSFEKDYFIGSEINRVGSGLGEEPRFEKGIINSLSSLNEGNVKGTIRFSACTVPGDSGGGLYHKNKLIGILQAIRVSGDGASQQHVNHMAYAIPISRFKNWNKELNNIMDFAFEKEVDLPLIPYFIVGMKSKEFNINIMPNTFWDKK